MKRLIALSLTVFLLAGCSKPSVETAKPNGETTPATVPEAVISEEKITDIVLSDSGIQVEGENGAVFTSNDIVYYEDKDAYESGNPYGEGEAWEKHTAQEAAAHTVVNIAAPGTYRVTGKLSRGQIRIDLGEEAYSDPYAVVELILSNANITCTVAPAILFMNVYECDGAWSVETAKPDVDTSAAGANLTLEGENVINGSHVAKVFKDQDEEKKLWKQDGAIYSYMSMNVGGAGKLDLYADNEGLDTELHLTIYGGDIAIRADNDGINTNEDGVSVTTINGGNLHIMAGLGAEGDGIDSNGYLVINGGTVVSSAHPAADAGLDSDLGSFIHGGTVIALGSAMDWAESDSEQVTMNLQFAQNQSADAALVVAKEDGTILFAYDPSTDEVLADNKRVYSGAVISCPGFQVGQTYHVYVDGQITGEDVGGVFDPATVKSYLNSTQMAYTGTDVMMRPGGMGFGGEIPDDFDPNKMPADMERFQPGQHPENMEPPEGFDREQPPEKPEGMQVPENFDPNQPPDTMPLPYGGRGDFAFGETSAPESREPVAGFYMQDKVNFFSGLAKL